MFESGRKAAHIALASLRRQREVEEGLAGSAARKEAKQLVA